MFMLSGSFVFILLILITKTPQRIKRTKYLDLVLLFVLLFTRTDIRTNIRAGNFLE
ncbi:hypothetical protein EC970010_4339 [Escherichia coli 97.0010]|nr:hypothetical protein EC960109_3970 [Escherichia coli 96.0109]EKY38049.1 hypothetical protein EC970010_4339 [Escherichia coli 97.0010]EZJ35600.1 hypothetical protein AD23_3965 [Escherichia coli 2-005-03_S4_C3]EZJ48575.1 hypothetical protein AC93_3831 [Escherichia coli 2-005-03_S4_C2]KDT25468.1 hypothetical protein AC67_4124 [Escherichia coli 2-052-05_S4_C1]